jgi:hypothetical protein
LRAEFVLLVALAHLKPEVLWDDAAFRYVRTTNVPGVRSSCLDGQGELRRLSAQFTINLASSATDVQVPSNIPAVLAQCMQAMQRTPETWHFPEGPPSSKVDGMDVID